MDAAVAAGITTFDTGELYPVPFSAGTFGRAEEVIGSWLTARRASGRVLVATKVVGRGDSYPWIRGGYPRLDRANIIAAVDGSLRRLRHDAIDLFQVHWPERSVSTAPISGHDHGTIPIEETFGVLADLIDIGKIRAVGVCNETPWGVMAYLRAAEHRGGPRIAAVQNPYNLLNRSAEDGLAEVVMQERCGFLAYSALAHGTLTGKYMNGSLPAGSRFDRFPFFRRYRTPQAEAAIAAYHAAAQDCGMTLLEAAIAFTISRSFISGAILAVSTVKQLENAVAATARFLPPELEARLDAIHTAAPNPCR